MRVGKALTSQIHLAREVAQLKALLSGQNSRASNWKFDCDNREVLATLRARADELVRVGAAMAAANAEIYRPIFRLAGSKGLVATLASLNTKTGVFQEGHGPTKTVFEVEYIAQIGKAEVDRLVAELNGHIRSLQDELDEFDCARRVNLRSRRAEAGFRCMVAAEGCCWSLLSKRALTC